MQFSGMIKEFSILLLLATYGVALGCGGSGTTGPTFGGSDECPGGCDNAGGGSDTESPDIDENEGEGDPETGTPAPESVDELIAALTIPGEGSNAFQVPATDKRTQFHDLITALLSGITAGHDATLSDLGYEMLSLISGGEADLVLALRETGSGTGAGTYLFHLQADSNLILEIPHPLSEENVLAEGAFLLQNLPARVLFIAGAHRCANDELSACSGSTDACDGTLRISDVAHATDNLFHEAHKAAHESDPEFKFISLHGFAEQEGDPAAVASNGTERVVGFLAYVNRLADAIEGQLPEEQSVTSCNGAGEPDSLRCGTDNVQGRYSNGSPDPCGEEAASYSGRFLHLEQASSLRDPASGWTLILNALEAIF